MTFNNPPKKTDDPFKSFKKPKRNFRCKHTIKRRNESKFLNLKEKKIVYTFSLSCVWWTFEKSRLDTEQRRTLT